MSPWPFADTFTGRDGGEFYRGIVDGIEAGRLSRLAFVLPAGPVWPLPLYELALLTAKYAHYRGRALHMAFVIADARPLAALGRDAGDIIARGGNRHRRFALRLSPLAHLHDGPSQTGETLMWTKRHAGAQSSSDCPNRMAPRVVWVMFH